MKAINTRYGASVELLCNSTDITAESADIFIGIEGEAYTFTKNAPFEDGTANLSLDPIDTMIPIGTYKYQINVNYSDGRIKKFPEPSNCEDNNLPEFIVSEALDVIEVS
jgi:hypothetical protein